MPIAQEFLPGDLVSVVEAHVWSVNTLQGISIIPMTSIAPVNATGICICSTTCLAKWHYVVILAQGKFLWGWDFHAELQYRNV